MAFGLVRESLECLEAHLALGDIRLAQQQEELARSWASFHAAIEARRLEDSALQAAREEAINFAKEIRDGAIHDAAELLEPLQAERDAAEELLRGATAKHEAMEGSLAWKRCELDRLESQLLSAHQAVQAALEEDRKCLAEHDRQLALRGSELQRCEEQFLQTEKDLAAQREALEAREGGLAHAISKFDEHVAAQKRSDERSERRFAKRTRAA